MDNYEKTLGICRDYLESVGISLDAFEDEDDAATLVRIYEDHALSKTVKTPYPDRSDLVKKDDDSILVAPRINALTEALDICGVEEVQDFYEGIPYVLVVDGETAFVCCYEMVSDNEYLLHFRADIPVDDTDTDVLKEKAEAFNGTHVFARCYLDQEDLGIFDDEVERVACFHAVIPDYGAIKDLDFYGFFAGMFQSEVMDF